MPPSSSKRVEWLATAAVAIAAGIPFLGSMSGPFLWDDQQFVVENLYLRSWRFVPELMTRNIVQGAGQRSNLYRPVEALTHLIDRQAWGFNAWGHHLTNILLHVAGIALLFRLLLSLLGRETAPDSRRLWIAAGAALLYGIHPLQCAQVDYISGRSDPLLLIFLCLSALSFRRGCDFDGMAGRRWIKYSLASAGFALAGMLSKENGALIPLFVLGLDACAWRPSAGLGRLKSHAASFAVAVVYVVLRLTALDFQDTLNFYGAPNVLTEHPVYRVYTYLSTLPKGLLVWLWPTDLHHERSWMVYTGLLQWPVWLGALVLIGAAWVLLASRKRLPLVSFGIAWFFMATFPTSNLVVLVNALFYDHWFLFPGVGLAIALVGGLEHVRTRPWLAPAAGWAVAACCVATLPLTYAQNEAWNDPIRLYEHVLSFEPRSAKIMNNLAMHLAAKGDLNGAERLYERAIRTSDAFGETHHNLAKLYLKEGKDELAESEFKRALELNPAIYQSQLALGELYWSRSRYDRAAEAFENALRSHPTPEAYEGLARCELRLGNPEKAALIRQEALKNRLGQ